MQRKALLLGVVILIGVLIIINFPAKKQGYRCTPKEFNFKPVKFAPRGYFRISPMCVANGTNYKESMVRDASSIKQAIKASSSSSFSCDGPWKDAYAKLHKKERESPTNRTRYLGYTCRNIFCGGIGNRLFGLISLFYLALMTDRVFIIDWKSDSELRDYLVPNMIDWHFLPRQNITMSYWGIAAAEKPFKRVRVDSEGGFLAWASQVDFESHLTDKVELIGSTWYFADALYGNKKLKAKIESKGLPKPEESFPYALLGCAFDFLFKRTTKLQRLLDEAKSQLSSRDVSKPPQSIGIHIRTSDFHFGSNNIHSVRSYNYRNYFSCAQQIEDLIAKKIGLGFGKFKGKWFLATDNEEVKHYTKVCLPHKVATLDFVPKHLDQSKDKDALGMVLVDLLLLAECDYFVATIDSTYSFLVFGLKRHSLHSYTFGEICNCTALTWK